MKTQRPSTFTASNPTSPANLPSTGNKFLDRALDQLGPDAKIAVVALLERYGQDGMIDRAKDRLSVHIEWIMDPDVLRDFCVEEDAGEMEESVGFWVGFRAGWEAMRHQS